MSVLRFLLPIYAFMLSLPTEGMGKDITNNSPSDLCASGSFLRVNDLDFTLNVKATDSDSVIHWEVETETNYWQVVGLDDAERTKHTKWTVQFLNCSVEVPTHQMQTFYFDRVFDQQMLTLSSYHGPIQHEVGYQYFVISINHEGYQFTDDQDLGSGSRAEIISNDADSIVVRIKVDIDVIGFDLMVTDSGNFHGKGLPGLIFIIVMSRFVRRKPPLKLVSKSPPNTIPPKGKDQVKTLIAIGNTGAALQAIVDSSGIRFPELQRIGLQARFHQNQEAFHKGIIMKEAYDLELNRINMAILSELGVEHEAR